MPVQNRQGGGGSDAASVTAPSISLPRGGGALRGIGEKFAVNPNTGTGSLTVPIAVSPGRAGFGPQLSLSYDSGAGNGPFGFGWSLALPSITRKTDNGLPQYHDDEESDEFILSGAEDLVPVLVETCGTWRRDEIVRSVDGVDYRIVRYRPRVEGLFARIERWTNRQSGEAHWRSITRDNVTTLYGKTAESRIVDPADPARVFSWLICESYDDKGNAIVYAYQGEDSAGIDPSRPEETNRTYQGRSANRYLKRVKYGNEISHLVQPDLTRASWMFEVVFDYDEGHYRDLREEEIPPDARGRQLVHATTTAARSWPVRQDPFSSYRARFEVRTYRLCRRVLMFHHFPQELGTPDYLVRSTEFVYRQSAVASFLESMTQSGYVRRDDGTYLKKSLPPLEYEYSRARIQEGSGPIDPDELPIREVDAGSVANLPAGLASERYQWVDLDGEGVSGILTEQANAWFYKPNRGQGRFGPVEVVPSKPSVAALSQGQQQLLDLAGDGQLDLVDFSGPMPGFQERTEDRDWEPFAPFRMLPNLAWDNPNLRFVDLTGDGHADVLITEDDVLSWHPSLAEEGFGPAVRIPKSHDEERGPRLVFADGEQSIYLADMSGDGLADLVRVRSGEICYWPSLGYGRFGTKVAMGCAPWLDEPDQFDQRRVRLADTDGTGPTDLVYLARDGVHIYFNQSGNAWSAPRVLPPIFMPDALSSVAVLDLLGNGTACVVWSSSSPWAARRPMYYLDLMGGQKPHLLVSVKNNLGAETRIEYAPSTRFYLADKAEGKPWITRLPFPVQVVERVVTYDHISRNRFVTRYAYHHGYFDGIEREFRGFGLLEQWDTEEFAALRASGNFPVGDNIDAASHVPPVHTKTWFHTGAHLGRGRVSDFFAGLLNDQDQGEYYREPGLTDAQARWLLLEDTELPAELPFGLPAQLTVEEEREACRALKGVMLRREVYALDGTGKAEHPYTVTEQNFTIRVLQPRGDNRHAVFFTHAREALNYHYERDPADPRVGHALTLEVDEFGNVLKEAAVGYGRRQPDMTLPAADRAKQTQVLITYTENGVTNAIDSSDDYRTPLFCEARTYELTGLTLSAGHSRFTRAEVLTAGTGAVPLASEQNPTSGVLQKRLVEHMRTLYRRNDLAGALPLGELHSLALPFESYKLAFTPGLLAGVYGGRLTDPMLEAEGRYVHSDGDASWWIPSGRVFYSPGSADTAAQELAHVRQHFFLPHRYRDPFHTSAVSTETFVSYDAHDLLMVETRDPLGNRVTVGQRDPAGNLTAQGNDYRVLRPRLVMDPNRNRTEAAFDALGMVVGTAVMGKPPPAPAEGDSLTGFEADLTETVILDHLANPLADPQAILRRATTRLVYDLFAYQRTKGQANPQPAVVYTLARETHDSDPVPTGGLKIQHSCSYSDGFGREIQKKFQAEAGPVPRRGADGKILVGADGQPEMTPNDVSPRWVGNGWTVFNNKGKPVRQYEPFFTDTHRFEFDVRVGVSPVLFYDPVERVVGILHPNHAWEKVVFNPWQQKTYDSNDTVRLLKGSAPVVDPKDDPTVGEFFKRLPDADYLPTWYIRRQAGALGPREQDAARKAAVHADTPTVTYFDTLGRAFLTVAHNKFKYSNAPAAPPAEEFHRTRVLLDIEGNWREVTDARDRVVMRYDYDMLGNRIHQASMEAGARWLLNDVAGKPLYAWDSRGHQSRTAYDALRRPTDSFLREGAGAELLVGHTVHGETRPNSESNNLRGKVVQLFDQAGVVTSDDYDFKGNLRSSRRRLARAYQTTLVWSAAVPLEAETYTSRTRHDALNRPVQLIAPHSDQPGTKVNVLQLTYNEANLLEQVEAWLNRNAEPGDLLAPGTADLHAVTDIDYDAKGRRTLIDHGNGVRTTYEYDPYTFRLVHLLTRRNAVAFPGDCPQPPPAGWPGCQVQNLHYTYDPVGNITHVRDNAQQTIYFGNKRVEPSGDYTHDAVYRLIEATGREHLGQAGGVPIPHSYNDRPRVGLQHNGDGNALGTYLERYVYDAAGNLFSMQHRGTNPANPGWTRAYAHNEVSQLELGEQSNRLTSTTIGATTETYSTAGDGYDPHGNLLRMPHLQVMQWDFKDQLRMTQRQAVNANDDDSVQHQGEHTWYVYDAGGQRVRKVTELATGQVKDERIYLGGLEIYRRQGVTPLIRETLHIMDGKQRVVLVETRTDTPVPEQLVRYQFGNHLGSASLELDDQAQVISYEEYTPYGSTSYQAVRSQTEAPKRYGHTGKERDEENGLHYHGARYYAAWLGRWTAADPGGTSDGLNLFSYVHNQPLSLVDPNGADSQPSPMNYATFEEYAEAMEAHGVPWREGYAEEEWGRNVQQFESQTPRVSANDFNPAPTQPPETMQEDLRRLQNVQTPLLSFIMPSHVAPYLRDQSAGIRNPYLRFQAQTNQRAGEAVARFTNRLGMATVAAYGIGMAAGYGLAVGIELAGPAVLAGGARLAAAYQEAGIWIGVNYPRLTAVGTAIAAGLAGTSLPSGGSSTAAPAAQQAARSVWSLNPFVRGRIIERILGQRLPGQFMTASNFPAIDKVVAGPGNIAQQVISIKSIDLGAASYRAGNAVFNRLNQYINSLANFTGATRSGQTVLTGASTQRVLEVAIPANVATTQQLNQLTAAAQEAARRGIQLNVRVFQ